jgi:hypothetical protein
MAAMYIDAKNEIKLKRPTSGATYIKETYYPITQIKSSFNQLQSIQVAVQTVL